ncbi:hypothetical protein [Hathewaya massiliensis]|uniref:hypothetical protein n=1 Tax=Hathewaya massiliensis TaxID=1964382 RepID=UPI00115A3CDC|nr:hypothetical protein [Hathewaya massiliensis]
MKEFYGSVSLSARVSFTIEAKDKETAEDIVFEDMEGLEIALKDGSKVEISEINWELINEARRGNVREPNIDDFEIYEEKDNSDLEMDCLVCNLGKERACCDCCRDWDNEEDE